MKKFFILLAVCGIAYAIYTYTQLDLNNPNVIRAPKDYISTQINLPLAIKNEVVTDETIYIDMPINSNFKIAEGGEYVRYGDEDSLEVTKINEHYNTYSVNGGAYEKLDDLGRVGQTCLDMSTKAILEYKDIEDVTPTGWHDYEFNEKPLYRKYITMPELLTSRYEINGSDYIYYPDINWHNVTLTVTDYLYNNLKQLEEELYDYFNSCYDGNARGENKMPVLYYKIQPIYT